MKKIKLLTPILGLSAIAGVIAPITSCGQKEKDPDEPETKGEFKCEQPEQTTVRGETACWYIFEYTGSEDIPNDINVSFNETHGELNPTVLFQITDAKELKVGIEGLRSQLTEEKTINFTLKFNSETLGLEEQLIDCKYTYLESKISAISPKVEEREKDVPFAVDAVFKLTNDTDKRENLSIHFDNVKKSDPKTIHDPVYDGSFTDVTKGIQTGISVTKNVDWNDGDWIRFDIVFTYVDGLNSWEQTITNYTYNVLDIDYKEDFIDTKCDIQIDVKGTTQTGLKAYDEDKQKGFLPKGTPINTPFALTFHESDTPTEWKDDPNFNFYKFGSFVDVTKYSSGYYHYFSVVVKIVDKDGKEQPLQQTYTGDREGELGEWWISTGGPITVIKKIIDKKYPSWQRLIFQLRTAEAITHDSSFYLTYAAN